MLSPTLPSSAYSASSASNILSSPSAITYSSYSYFLITIAFTPDSWYSLFSATDSKCNTVKSNKNTAYFGSL